MEEQRAIRLRGSLLLHVFGADRSNGNRDRYQSLSRTERAALEGMVESRRSAETLTEKGHEARIDGVEALRSASLLLAPPRDVDSIPTHDEIAERLELIGGISSTMRLKMRLLDEGWRVSRAELGMQRAIADGAITLERDWTVRTVDS
ncbi:hypothetical protein [uncultured Salinicola sp.]|uniref:hypothetical protein n=1 Tax=uncultured Salinicola sp. TaxID=1193542 RepID=UPI0026353728|nr:hypothetical protein [uncultured Salinicola sp.]|tara:strand:+ start:806 stop:1249 length:444 start_codon:yes stop_codon:yes gene_type:complete